jgi:hypothetical protein
VKILRTIEDRGQEPLLPHERVMEASLSAESSMSNIVELFFLRSDQSIFFNGLDCKWNRNRLIFSSYVHKQPFVRWRQSPVVFAKVCNRQNIQTLQESNWPSLRSSIARKALL